MLIDVDAARHTLASYASEPLPTRAFVLARLVVAPLGPMDDVLRSLSGRVLSVGAGHTVVERYLARINPNVEIVAYDLNAERIEIAQRTTTAGSRVEALVGDAIAMSEPGTFDAVLAIDLMHHVPETEHLTVARGFHERLRPGGVCLVKDIATTPRHQYLWNRLHDRIVSGPDPIFCRDPFEMALVFADAGFRTEDVCRLKRLDPYPHYLLRLRRDDPFFGQVSGQ